MILFSIIYSYHEAFRFLKDVYILHLQPNHVGICTLFWYPPGSIYRSVAVAKWLFIDKYTYVLSLALWTEMFSDNGQ